MQRSILRFFVLAWAIGGLAMAAPLEIESHGTRWGTLDPAMMGRVGPLIEPVIDWHLHPKSSASAAIYWGNGVSSPLQSSDALADANLSTDPNLQKMIEKLRGQSREEILDSLDDPLHWLGGQPGDLISSKLSSAASLPPDFGVSALQHVCADLRFDRLLKQFQGPMTPAEVDDLSRRMQTLAIEQERRFALALQVALAYGDELRHPKDVETFNAACGRVSKAVGDTAEYKAAPNVMHALSMLLILAGTLHAEGTGKVVQDIAQRAANQRRQLYSMELSASAMSLMFGHSLYHRQPLTSALLGTARNPESLQSTAVLADLRSVDTTTVPFDARDASPGGIMAAESGVGTTLTLYPLVSDATFDGLLDAAIGGA